MSEALIRLEEKHMFLEKQVEDLDVAVRELFGQVDALRKDFQRLERALQQLAEPPEETDPD